MTEYEFILEDRITKIKSINEQYDLLNKAYISFSGGKDSTVLHYLLDLAIPNNKIPRVFSNTGIEYAEIVKYVKTMAESDDRFTIIRPKKNIKEILEKYGYPFKSKEHSDRVSVYQNSGKTRYVVNYLGEGEKYKAKQFQCPDELRYQFTEGFKLKVSKNCCRELKKKPLHEYQKETGKTIAMTGMRQEEGGQRANISNCVIMDKDKKVYKFHPLLVVTEDFIDWFVKENNIRLCSLYYPPYNFKRTGCKGCPFNPLLKEQLETMSVLLPAEKKQCEMIWKPVYDEYRRIGYRLDNQPSLFD